MVIRFQGIKKVLTFASTFCSSSNNRYFLFAVDFFFDVAEVFFFAGVFFTVGFVCFVSSITACAAASLATGTL